MSIPGILFNIGVGLAGSNQTEARNTIKQGKQDFEQLLEALRKGDLTGAQQVLSGLQQLQAGLQNSPPPSAANAAATVADSTATVGRAGPLATDFAALGSSLKSGNLAGAQDAYAKLQQDVQSLRQQGNEFGSLGRAAQVQAVLQQLGVSGAMEPVSTRVDAFVSTLDKIKGDAGTLQQALQSGNASLSQEALTRLLQDLRASSLLGREVLGSGSALLASA